jgi:hypothetical protein
VLSTPCSGVIGPTRTVSESHLPSRQTVGAGASEHQRLMTESKAPKRFEYHMAMVMSRSKSEATFDEQVAGLLIEAFPRGKDVHFRDKFTGVSDTFLAKREC